MEKTSPCIRAADSLPADSPFQADIEQPRLKLRIDKTTFIHRDKINKCKPNQNDGVITSLESDF